MPDWSAFIGERLGRDAESAVVSELASHLEEVYEEARARGSSHAASIERALQEVKDWRVLATQIRLAKGEDPMRRRIRSFWLPALFTLVGASASLAACLFFRLKPHYVVVEKACLLCYWWWLATLPIFGAAGAYSSLRGEGTPWTRLAASLSPSLFIVTVMCVILATGGLDLLRDVGFDGAINWVLIPGLASMLGALPFIFQSKPAKARVL